MVGCVDWANFVASEEISFVPCVIKMFHLKDLIKDKLFSHQFVLLLLCPALAKLKRHRSGSASPVQKDLNRVVEEQAAVIESLKSEKKDLESEVATLKKDHERSQKENSVLRRAVAIQQERQKNAETQVKAAEEYRVVAEEKIRKLEHLVMALRYHLQTQQNNVCNDFMGMPPRPPDVF